MAKVSIIPGMKRITNEDFLKKADTLKPELIKKVCEPKAIVDIAKNADGFGEIIAKKDICELANMRLSKGDKVCLDFGNHYVGYMTLHISSAGSPPDAPLYLKLKFGENATEITDRSEDYDGWISRSWIQEEFIHIDVLPAVVTLPRRYAMRFLEITVIDSSPKYQAVIDKAEFMSVSSVDGDKIADLAVDDEMIKKIDRVSIKTLEDCMQDVFEDGPKRDRRLWIGDLRLQALANYATFQNYDLVKRCLYLFAGTRMENGAVGACLFTEPNTIVDDTYLYDYAMFFTAILLDYYKACGDKATALKLWDVAYRQLEIGIDRLGDNDVVTDGGDDLWCFIDWKEGLNKQAAAQGVLIYCLKCGIELGKLLEKDVSYLEKNLERAVNGAKSVLWDKEQKLFVSGSDKQISYASQIWMILAGVFDKDANRELLNRIVVLDPEMDMVTPYMYHNFIMAFIECGDYDGAMKHIKSYWGEMINDGADTFWELYNPKNKNESPYGSSIVNSYCHAWSCTPTYLFRQYFFKE
ncbi:MAG: sugar hydrolase [Acutalibacteraceae bacterium]